VRHCCNGLLAGLVGVTSCAGFIEPWAAAVIGLITGPLYVVNSRLLLRLGIDDPLDSSTVHFASGVVRARAPASLLPWAPPLAPCMLPGLAHELSRARCPGRGQRRLGRWGRWEP
jgi:hypothetical protein